MAKLSDKYIAGFVDADGCIAIQWKGGKYKPLITLSASQKTCNDRVLHLIQEALGGQGYIRMKQIKGSSYSEFCLSGSPAHQALNRIKNHLIIKRHYAEWCLHAVAQGVPEDLAAMKAEMKRQRRVPSLPIPNFPPRKWLAGYVDGDGSFVVGVNKVGSAHIRLSIGSWEFDTEGVQCIAKVFGGSFGKLGERNTNYVLSMPPSKAKQVLGYFAKHLVLKRDQAEFILGCAAMDHFKDGENIAAAMKQLKARDHRLSEPSVDVSRWIETVRDIRGHRNAKGRKAFAANGGCEGCGSQSFYASGVCRSCYDIRRGHKRQSDTQTA